MEQLFTIVTSKRMLTTLVVVVLLVLAILFPEWRERVIAIIMQLLQMSGLHLTPGNVALAAFAPMCVVRKTIRSLPRKDKEAFYKVLLTMLDFLRKATRIEFSRLPDPTGYLVKTEWTRRSRIVRRRLVRTYLKLIDANNGVVCEDTLISASLNIAKACVEYLNPSGYCGDETYRKELRIANGYRA